MLDVLTREDYYGASVKPAPEGWVAPFVHPDECDHQRDDDAPDALCSQCCPCDLCGLDRAEP